MNTESRGSMWHKWDLHLHTASSYDYKYKAKDSDELLVKALKENEVSAVAITDHFVVDKERIINIRKLAGDIIVFPGVELRTDKGATNTHVILIFSNEIDIDALEEDFNAFKRGSAQHSDDNEKIYWDFGDIEKFAKKHDALISIHAGKKSNGIDKNITNALECSQVVKEDYAQKIDIFEVGKIEDINDYKSKVFPNIGCIKPMIICSDNHNPREYEPSNSLWIKSDLTFSGLKQICYEPEERVFVSEERPQCNAAYQVIKYVQISDSDFSSEKIYFNPYLTCIIGGKSTGKSLLLHNMAKKLDEDQIKEKEAIANFKTKDVQDIKIIWDDNEENNERAIVYIPQSYLNSLADEKEKATEIDEMISKVVFSNEGCRELKEQLENKTQLISNEIRTLINELFNCYVTKNNAEEERANIGDERGVKKEIDSIKKELEKLSGKSELSEEEIEKYQNAVENTAKLENEISSISNDEHILETITTVVRPFISENNLSSSTKLLLNTGAKEVISFADKKWLEEKRKKSNTVTA